MHDLKICLWFPCPYMGDEVVFLEQAWVTRTWWKLSKEVTWHLKRNRLRSKLRAKEPQETPESSGLWVPTFPIVLCLTCQPQVHRWTTNGTLTGLWASRPPIVTTALWHGIQRSLRKKIISGIELRHSIETGHRSPLFKFLAFFETGFHYMFQADLELTL